MKEIEMEELFIGGSVAIFKAVEHLLNSNEYSIICAKNYPHSNKNRVYKSKFKKGDLQTGAMINLLIKNGYKVSISPPQKLKK